LSELTTGEIASDAEYGVRVISGSVLSGRAVAPPVDFLSRYDSCISLLQEGKHRELLGWTGPGFNKFSIKPIFASALSAGKKFAMTTSTEGSHRAIVPLGSFEKVMPLDIIATPLLKSLVVEDTEQAQALGCLELDEEDLALCTFVDTGKHEFGPILRRNLTTIEREG
jgi:Na+-transporting NADH:ubiquinone oxidoreductase subunit A